MINCLDFDLASNLLIKLIKGGFFIKCGFEGVFEGKIPQKEAFIRH
jgi:hypothetical protein